MRPRITRYLLGAVLVLLVVGAFLPTTHNGFINFDDNVYVTENTHVQQGLTWANLGWALTTGAAANWHPATWLSHILDWELFGLKAWGHHLTSVLLHAVNTLLLFILLRRITGTLWRSFFVAALFGVHPLRVESVAWVAERKDVLSGFFFMLTLWAYAKYARQSTVHSPRSTGGSPKSKVQDPKSSFPASNDRFIGTAARREAAQSHEGQRDADAPIQNQKSKIKNSPALFYCLTLWFFVLGLMSKPMLVTLPFVLLLLDFWPLQRWEGGPGPGSQVGWRRLVAEKIPFLLLAATVSVVTFVVQRHGGAVWGIERLALNGRIENALVAYVRYMGKIFWPTHLAVFYPHPGSWPVPFVLLAAVLLLGVTAWVWLSRRRAPFLLVGWLWFLGTLVPVIGLVQAGWQSIADRYTYIPSIGILLLVVWGTDALLRKPTEARAEGGARPLAGTSGGPADLRGHGLASQWARFLPAIVAGVIVLVCTALTRQELGYWKDSETLFRRALAVTENNFVAHYDLGIALLSQGRLDEAVSEFQVARKLRPSAANACNALGEALVRQGRLDEAMEQFHQAVALQCDSAVARNNLGIELTRKGALDQAIAEFQEALKARPDYTKARVNLGMAFQAQGRLDQALAQLEEAVRVAPQDGEARNSLGMVLGRSGRVEEAVAQLQEAVRLDPSKAQAHHNLGLALSRSNRPVEAAHQFELALELNPNSPETHASLAAALIQLGRKQEAIQQLNQALQLRPGYPPAEQQIRALTSDRGGQ